MNPTDELEGLQVYTVGHPLLRNTSGDDTQGSDVRCQWVGDGRYVGWVRVWAYRSRGGCWFSQPLGTDNR